LFEVKKSFYCADWRGASASFFPGPLPYLFRAGFSMEKLRAEAMTYHL